jgi:hypothetical protein
MQRVEVSKVKKEIPVKGFRGSHSMPNDVFTETNYAQFSDEELVFQLKMRIKELEERLRLAERRLKEMRSKLIGSLFILTLTMILLLFFFAITMAPYIVGKGGNVPQVLSYVSAFLVVILGFLTYRAYERYYIILEGQRFLRDNLEEGKVTLENAYPVLEAIATPVD